MKDQLPGRLRGAVDMLALRPEDRVLEVGGGSGVAASLVLESLEAAGTSGSTAPRR